jgi:hypothetical protein
VHLYPIRAGGCRLIAAARDRSLGVGPNLGVERTELPPRLGIHFPWKRTSTVNRVRPRKLSVVKIASMLRDAESGLPTPAICAAYGIGVSTFYELKSLYGDASVTVIERMESQARENTSLCRRIALLEQEVAMLTAALRVHARTSADRRAAVSWLIDNYRIALSRACRLVGISRSFFLYQSSAKEQENFHAQVNGMGREGTGPRTAPSRY